MLKKFSALLIMFIILFSLSGCASGGYEINVYSDGRILESFYIELNQNAIELAGYDYLAVQTQVLEQFESVRTNLINTFNAADNGLNPIQKSQIRQGIRLPSVENNVIGVSFLFSNYNDYKLFYGIVDEPEEPSNEIVENKIFYIKTTTVTSTAFKNAQNSTIANQLLDYFSDPENGNIAFTFSDINFSYSYATSSSKLRSNADRVYYTTSGLKVHKWNVPTNNYDMQIEFYEYQIISTWWYILALFATALFVIALLITHNLDKYAKKKRLILEQIEVVKPAIDE